LKVRDLGEQGLLRLLQTFCPADVVGDDAAVLETQPGLSLVVTSDVLVDGVHFSDRTTSPADAGWRAAAVNLSDLAAMGAQPLGITLGLGLPPETPVAWVEGLYQGLVECLRAYGTVIVGGDICRSPVLTLAVTAFGQVAPGRVLRRSQAQVGDAILVTGPHGYSRAGLELLLNPDSLPPTLTHTAALIRAHQRPCPRLDVLPFLPPGRIAGMDSSDGLADAVIQICRASGVGAELWGDRIPYAHLAPLGPTGLDWALYGGEDFELVLCLAPAAAADLLQRLGPNAAIIGTIVPGANVTLIPAPASATISATPDAIPLTLERGFQHFQ
jgi:thiamine-monophosphate kinase